MALCGQLSAQEVSAEPDGTDEPEEISLSAPEPLPTSLEDLIPQSAMDDAQSWAARGVQDQATDQTEPDLGEQPSVDPLSEVDPEAGIAFDPDAAMDAFAIPVPQPLAPEEDLPSFAEIDAPDLVDLPDLVEVELSRELTLAFPAAKDEFPEQAKFVARFRALSSIEALESSDDTAPQLAARARSDEALLQDVLRNYGYYSGDVVRQLSGGRRAISDDNRESAEASADSQPKVRFDILPGMRYSFCLLYTSPSPRDA